MTPKLLLKSASISHTFSLKPVTSAHAVFSLTMNSHFFPAKAAQTFFLPIKNPLLFELLKMFLLECILLIPVM